MPSRAPRCLCFLGGNAWLRVHEFGEELRKERIASRLQVAPRITVTGHLFQSMATWFPCLAHYRQNRYALPVILMGRAWGQGTAQRTPSTILAGAALPEPFDGREWLRIAAIPWPATTSPMRSMYPSKCPP